ncbi:MAG: phosphotransferase [Myxococcota bacterium]|nr:phosphotransferase [Myxococcota bacterium]
MSALLEWIRDCTGATRVHPGAHVQTLWRGYGSITRHRIEGASTPSVIAKVVRPPPDGSGPGHVRKVRSYAVERTFYAASAQRVRPVARVPQALGARENNDESWLLIEDLDISGFAARHRHLDADRLGACLDWLGAFHGTFIGQPIAQLWPRGTYWHLGTRSEELRRMTSGPLRDAAGPLDAALARCPMQTLLHGDPKPANFCFPTLRGAPVAAVDFQYAGGGVGVVDVVYLLSCMPARWRVHHVDRAIDRYFVALRRHAGVQGATAEAAWRPLVDIAWADLARFLAGWCGDDWSRDEDGAPRVRRAMDMVRNMASLSAPETTEPPTAR